MHTTFSTRLLFRPSHLPSQPVAIGARSVGHYHLPGGYRDVVIQKDFTQIFWGVAGEGALVLSGKPHTLGPGQIALYFPGDVHEVYNNGSETWEYRWWTMDGPLAAPVVNAFNLQRGHVYDAGPAPVTLFERLTDAIRDVTIDGEQRAGAVAYELLSVAAGAVRAHSTKPSFPEQSMEAFKNAVLLHIHKRWRDASFGIEELSEAMQMPRWGLTRRFRAAFGISPSDYLQRWRIQHALSLLKESRLPVHEVARQCGWNDPNYFARAIKKATQRSPLQFRAG